MKKITLIFSLIIGVCNISTAQTTENISEFIPQGYEVLQQVKGNLNLDKIDDLIVVLKKKGEDTLSSVETPVKRKLLILTGTTGNKYKLAAQNENVVCYYGYDANFIDAFVDMNIDSGQFSISHYGGFATRWARTITFKYDEGKKNWFLFEDEFTTFEATDEEGTEKVETKTEKDFGKISFEKFDVYKEE